MNIKQHIPNTITCCNLISGCTATTFALFGYLPMAFIFIVIGAVFDFFDGMTARLLHVSSPIGKELDSLADVITFGFAPSAMLFYTLTLVDYPAPLQPYAMECAAVAFVMAAFSALRLAKFNLDERQSMGFIGLPTPANALFWASLLSGWQHFVVSYHYALPLLVLGMAVFSWLLVSEIPMFALKFKQWGWKGNEVKYGFVLVSACLLLVFRLPAFALIIGLYILISIATARKA